ncbi:NAD(P)H-dependent glycerol-3-phosphate dehydrogenase [Staphylococcus simiae]|uniref:NAD(P)H-dependent glycerol-3-phosphate dehydrogenase n=1 Tax=Staphylococcus simiae TaxID=308354 RepID=UPI001A96DECA|nr:NAD(P)H-dependent glycerol-3-phosphate dehydrogenase [Staphylococcus simiae]MBO1197878.1 NAD(P)H-dependent glycerol-3-phosphate dehydrogenase [Staphylococcus simiae]MBO1200069.1 NAD(P)H-dependent glycerol-3-phosphate dehydrogenase [Staphylococcus simiae]MBO1202342.1 NAD(P)H-dependent glycerol-3-phosphate dehydrogenase [Staphylococcus simiae]MBO1209869.1 NAD(P)H-dependent glycerol-3-phosphate dehydrogenase [Staphylococcus simiae]MBO1228486.1 NAD(P)H-dependent glycerol-3-phosphate dehydrogena
MTKVTVFGMGSFGTALANVLAENGHDVLMWGKNQQSVDELNLHHMNKKYLKYAKLNQAITAITDMDQAINFADIYLMALPTKAMREVTTLIDSKLTSKKTFIHVAKGIENETFKRVSEMIEDSVSPEHNAGIGVLSGPSHAEEVVVKQPTTVAASSKDEQISHLIQDLFMNDYLRVYTNNDLVGVELGGALKNIIAVASGIVAGIGFGDNAKAALMTRGLAEISRLGEKLGADPMTFLGLGGIGDLIVTCTSTHSRNYTLGYKLGQGESMEQALAEMNMVVEGVYTTNSVYHLAKEQHVDMPITNALYRVLFENISVKECVKELMERDKKAE